MGKGSIIFKIIIILLALLLISVIAIPNDIWEEEDQMTRQSRHNIYAIYEAEQFFHRKTGSYTENFDTLITVIQSDTTLKEKEEVGNLSNELNDILAATLTIPSLRYISTISKAVAEMQGDIRINERYFHKNDDLNRVREELGMNLTRFDSSAIFPDFCETKSLVDSLSELKDKINEYRLQNATYLAKNQMANIAEMLPTIEVNTVVEFWNNEYNRIKDFIREGEKTDIARVSNMFDRLSRFSSRINNNVQELSKVDIQGSLQNLFELQTQMENIYQKFISPQYFRISQRYGLLSLSEVDSTLLNLTSENFTCPDSKEKYIISIVGEKITIESPNLLDEFASQNRTTVEPIMDLQIFDYISKIDDAIDSTNSLMDEKRVHIRRYSNLLLNMKEIMAEFKNLKTVPIYRYAKDTKTLIDTIQVVKQLSVLKPMFEDALNPMDTLATRIENHNFSDLEERLTYLGNNIQNLDSLISAERIPGRVKREIPSFYENYKVVFSIVDEMKRNIAPDESTMLRQVATELEKSLLKVLNGYEEPVNLIFTRTHENHGYIKNGVKSWEEEA